METKKCAKCGQILPIEFYSRNGNTLQSWCKKCQNEYQKNRYGRNDKGFNTKSIKTPKDKTLFRLLADLKYPIRFSDILLAQLKSGYSRKNLCEISKLMFKKNQFGYYEIKESKAKNIKPQMSIYDYTNDQLFAELKRRGITGTLKIQKEIVL